MIQNLKEVLDGLESLNLFVHVIDPKERYPFFYSPGFQTHFLMKEGEIVHVGNITTITAIALRGYVWRKYD